MIPLTACDECGSVIHPDRVNLHRAWHVALHRFRGDVNELFETVIDGLEGITAVQELDRLQHERDYE